MSKRDYETAAEICRSEPRDVVRVALMLAFARLFQSEPGNRFDMDCFRLAVRGPE